MSDINEMFGQQSTVVDQKELEERNTISPFDFINSINYKKDNIIVDEWSEKSYQPFLINKGLSYMPDTVIQANEMNSRPHIDKKLQYDFLINIVRSRKRFAKWIKPEKNEAIKIVQDYYGYSKEKAHQVLPLLSQHQIDNLKQKLKKGGIDDE